MLMKIATTDVFERWFTRLRDRQAAIRIQARIDRLEDGNWGDWQSVGEGVCEMRFHFGPGYRLYFMQHEQCWIVLLAGGDKSTQSSDIAIAKRMAHQLQEQER